MSILNYKKFKNNINSKNIRSFSSSKFRRLNKNSFKKEFDFFTSVDFEKLKVGDIVLFEGKKLKPNAFLIRFYQRRKLIPLGESDDSSRWTHAAIYVGEGKVVESGVCSGVSVSEIMKRLSESNNVVILRAKEISDLQRYKIALGIYNKLNSGYSMSAIFYMMLDFFGLNIKISRFTLSFIRLFYNLDKRFTCSGLCAMQFHRFGGGILPKEFEPPAWATLPGHLRQSSLLQEVDIEFIAFKT